MINNPAIAAEIEQITGTNVPPVSWHLTAHLVVDGAQVLTFRNVVNEKISADFASSVGPYRFITVQLGLVTYRDFIVPNQNKMKVVLRRRIRNPVSGAPSGEIVKSYLAFLPEPLDLGKFAGGSNFSNDYTDEYNLVTFQLELVEEELYKQMNMETSSVFSGRTDEVVANQLQRALENNQDTSTLKKQDYHGLRGIRTEKFQNDRVYTNMPVEQGVRLKNLCKYIQEKYGISSFGINSFFLDGFWYLFPLFKHDRFNKTKRTMTIYNIPQSEMPTIDNSFSLRGGDLFVLSTGTTRLIDDSIRKEVNDGNGLRMTPASFYDDNHFAVKSNKVVVKGSTKAREFISKEAGHGIYNVKYDQRKFNANPYPEISNLNSSQGGLVTLSWHNADVSLLFPGMATRIYYEDAGELKFVDGTLLGINALTKTQNDTFAEQDYRTSVEMTFHVKEK